MSTEIYAHWPEIVQAPPNTVYIDREEEKLRFVVLRGFSSLCAYVGIPELHPLAWRDYDSLTVSCHGGLSYGNIGGRGPLPKGYFWYGWDYAHYQDAFCFPMTSERVLNEIFEDRPFSSVGFMDIPETHWVVEMVDEDSVETLEDFRALMEKAEAEDTFPAKVRRYLLRSFPFLFWRESPLRRRWHRFLWMYARMRENPKDRG